MPGTEVMCTATIMLVPARMYLRACRGSTHTYGGMGTWPGQSGAGRGGAGWSVKADRVRVNTKGREEEVAATACDMYYASLTPATAS